jgi:hypothetical protein
MHMTLRLYELTLRGVTTRRWFMQLVHRHLGEVCPTCADGSEGRPPIASPPEDRRSSRPSARDFALEHYEGETAHRSRLRAIARRARKDKARLLRLPPERWVETLDNAKTRFRSRTFLVLLLDEARSVVRQVPQRAAAIAALVPVALDQRQDRGRKPWAAELRLRADAHRANALRVAGDLPASERIFAELRRRRGEPASVSLAVVAEITSLEASLRIGQARFPQAEELLQRTAAIYRELGDPHALARTLIKQANTAWLQGQASRTLQLMEQAATSLEAETDTSDPTLMLCSVTGRILALCELDRYGRAARLLRRHRRDYEAADDEAVAALALSLQGRIAGGLGDLDKAERLHVACRDAYLALGRGHDAALACLDVADALLAAGKIAELRDLAASLPPLFKARGVERETLAALRLLAEAARSETLTALVVAEVRRRLEPAGRSAALPAEP